MSHSLLSEPRPTRPDAPATWWRQICWVTPRIAASGDLPDDHANAVIHLNRWISAVEYARCLRPGDLVGLECVKNEVEECFSACVQALFFGRQCGTAGIVEGFVGLFDFLQKDIKLHVWNQYFILQTAQIGLAADFQFARISLYFIQISGWHKRVGRRKKHSCETVARPFFGLILRDGVVNKAKARLVSENMSQFMKNGKNPGGWR